MMRKIRNGRLFSTRRTSLLWYSMIIIFCWCCMDGGMMNAYTIPTTKITSQHPYKKHRQSLFQKQMKLVDDDNDDDDMDWSRRDVLIKSSLWFLTAATATTALPANAAVDNGSSSLLAVKNGEWSTSLTPTSTNNHNMIPADFVSYLARIMIRYDSSLSNWYSSTDDPEDAFAKLSKSIQLSLLPLFSSTEKMTVSDNMQTLTRQLQSNYPQISKRHLQLLMSMLPSHQQPSHSSYNTNASPKDYLEEEEEEEDGASLLLPKSFSVKKVPSNNGSFYLEMTPSLSTIHPPSSFSSANNNRDDWQMTKFGPISKTTPLTRPLEQYSLAIYSLFALSGATGCALTHSLVIPLDVVKTRLQTSPDNDNNANTTNNNGVEVTKKRNLLESAQILMKEEGASIFLLGSQATVLGYLWYGLTIYPLYTFLKRFFLLNHYLGDANAALLAGALGAVVASVGLTPTEACRIRAVAQPDKYANGVIDTFQQLYREGENALFAGFTSLTIRQVIFGTVKFLAFERFRDAIFVFEPTLRDSTVTVLGVSLLAGALSGALSSIVSQPADSVLTYVAQNPSSTLSADGKSSSLLQGCQTMVQENGYSSLLRGLGSRCVWASFIIAGQFLLYDIFRTFFGVNESDLIQTYQIMFSSSSSS